MKKLLLFLTVLFVQQSCFSVDDTDNALVQKPYERVLNAVSSLDSELLKTLHDQYSQTCLVCAEPLNVLQAIPIICSMSQDKTKIFAQIRELESAQQTEEVIQDLESTDPELIRFSVHRACEQEAKEIFLEDSKNSKHSTALMLIGLSLGTTAFIGILFLGVTTFQKLYGDEGEGSYDCHLC